MEHMPDDMNRGIVIFPKDGNTGTVWFGMSARQAAETLYSIADEIVEKRIPLPKGFASNETRK